MKYTNLRSSDGVTLEEWLEQINNLIARYEVESPGEEVLIGFYHDDFSYREVLLRVLHEELKHTGITMLMGMGQGKKSDTFQNNKQAGDFIEKFPELRGTFMIKKK